MEQGPKYFKDETDEETIRQFKIDPRHYAFRALLRFTALQFIDTKKKKCVIVRPTGTFILSPEYIEDVLRLPEQQTMDHILETAKKMQNASSIHIVYRASRRKIV